MPDLTITPVVPVDYQTLSRRNKRLYKFCQYAGCDKKMEVISTPYTELCTEDPLENQMCDCHKLKISKAMKMYETVFSNLHSLREVEQHIKNVVETEPRKDYYYCLDKKYFPTCEKTRPLKNFYFHVTCETELVYQWFLLTWKPDFETKKTLQNRVKSCVYSGNLWQVPNCIFLDIIYVAVQIDLIAALRSQKLRQVLFEKYSKAPQRIELNNVVEEIYTTHQQVLAIGVSEPKVLKYDDFVAAGFSSIEARMMEVMLKRVSQN